MKNTKIKVLLAVLILACLFVPMNAFAAPPSGSLQTAIMQVIPGVGTFTGNLTTTSFQVVNGVLSAIGTISGTLTSPTGNLLGTVTNVPITIPLTGITGSCTILTLHTGAINLTLLGLNVTLSPIDLVITAQAGPGNLLGNLLCAVAHLLDSNGALTAIASLLNQILNALKV